MTRAAALVILAACGRPGASENVAAHQDDAAMARPRDASVTFPDLPRLELGMHEVGAFAYRTRAGQGAFRLARDAEAKGDWTGVLARCREALATDPDHLDAAYLYAVAVAKTGGGAELLIPALDKAVAGDYGKWGKASLAQPALQPFLASGAGERWRTHHAEGYRKAYLDGLARALLVTAQRDLYAFDDGDQRFLRLTRTGGAVIGALHVPSQHRIAYVTRQRVKKGKPRTKVGIGVVDLATGRTLGSLELPAPAAASATLRIGYSVKKPAGFLVRAGKQTWRLVEGDTPSYVPVAGKTDLDAPAYLADMVRLEVHGQSARIDRTAVENVTADWDDNSLASAIKIGRSKKVVTAPSPGLIDGDTATWSPDGTQLAFVAQLSETCAPNTATAAAFVVDAATGSVKELERAVGGIALEWTGARVLAIAGDHGVTLLAGNGNPPNVLAGADGLVMPRSKPKCSPEPVIEEPVADDDDSATVEATDAGVDAK